MLPLFAARCIGPQPSSSNLLIFRLKERRKFPIKMHFEIFLLNIENNICNTPLPCSSYDLTLTPKLINFLTNSGFRNFIALNKYA